MTSPMLTAEALEAMRWMQPQADAAAFLAAQDRDALAEVGIAALKTELGWSAIGGRRAARIVIDALLDGPDE